jgi:hypothetical protein
MIFRDELKSAVLVVNESNFKELALEIFKFQASENPTYRQFIKYLKINPNLVTELEKIPFLPIGFFKNHQIVSANALTEAIFESSGTTGQTTSKHHVADLAFYETISTQIFEQQYAPLSQFHVLALLPSYLERNNSSLVYMVQHFIKQTGSEHSGFYLNNFKELNEKLRFLLKNDDGKQILLMGVTFGLLDFLEAFQLLDLPTNRLIVMETGGMKGRRREMIRAEVHEILNRGFGVQKIHSEYGMTELLSQGYSKGDGFFDLPPSMKILFRDVSDPFDVQIVSTRSAHGLNVIDLANVDSCAFIETQDLGNFNDQQLSVIGRFDNADVRGCNLMVV